jgi:hypothetical protein
LRSYPSSADPQELGEFASGIVGHGGHGISMPRARLVWVGFAVPGNIERP